MQKEMLRIGIVIILACLMLTCSEERTTVPKTINVHFTDTIYFEIDSVTSLISQVSYWESKDRLDKYLILFNSRLPAIQFYNWDSKKLLYKIYLEKDGPNGISNPTSVLVHNLDTIYVVSKFQYMLYQIDGAGKVIAKLSLLPSNVSFDANGSKPQRHTDDALFAVPIAGMRNPMIKKGEWIFIPVVSQIPFFTENKKLIQEGKSVMGININTGDLKFMLDYSEIYKEKNSYYPPQLLQPVIADIPNTNQILASFQIDKNVQIINVEDGSIEDKNLKSPEIDKPTPMKSLEMDVDMHTNNWMNNSHYERVLFDPYRKLNLRIAVYPDKKNPFVRAGDNSNFKIRYTLLIADENFNLLEEVNVFDEGFTNMNTFFTPEAFYFQFQYSTEDEIAFRKVVFRFADSSFK